MIRVAQVYGVTGAGGSEATFMRIYRHLDRSQIQFDWLVQTTGLWVNEAEIKALGGRVLNLPTYRHPRSYVRALTEIFRREQYDIVHTHNNALGVLALKAARQAGIKIRILHAHSTTHPREGWRALVKAGLLWAGKKYATHQWAVSRRAGTYMFGRAAVDQNRVTIFHNALSLESLTFDQNLRVATRQAWQLTEQQLVVGHVGRMTRQKNHQFLFRVWAAVVRHLPTARLLLVGDGPLRPRLERQARRLGIADHIIWAGEQSQMAPMYAAMDGFVLPSWFEGLPGAAVEAQINGLPCLLSTDVTAEAVLTPRTRQLSLRAGVKAWADHIITWATMPRVGGDIPNAGDFDAATKAVQLSTAYVKMVTEAAQ